MRGSDAKRRLRAVREFLDGKPQKSICRKFGCCRQSLYFWVKKYRQNPQKASSLLANHYRRGRKHPRSIAFKCEKIILDLVVGHPHLNHRQLSQKLKEASIEVSASGVYKILVKHDLHVRELREEFSREHPSGTVITSRLTPAYRAKVVEELLIEGKKVCAICRKWLITRPTFYEWLKRYREAEQQKVVEALVRRYKRGHEHHRSIGSEAREIILELVRTNPALSVHKLYAQIPRVTGRPIASHVAIQNLLARENLNIVAKRREYAQTAIVEPAAKVAPRYVPEIPVYHWRLLFAPFKTVPKLLLTKPFAGLRLAALLISPFLFLLIWVRLLLAAPQGSSIIGLLLASVAFFFGVIFFIYSLKYYISVLLVLRLAQSGAGQTTDNSQLTIDKNQQGQMSNVKGQLLKILSKLGLRLPQRQGPNPLLVNLEKVELTGPKPFVAIHVAVYNEKKVVERLIQACVSQAWTIDNLQLTIDKKEKTSQMSKVKGQMSNYEVVIVDDSNDETTEMAKQVLTDSGWQVASDLRFKNYDLRDDRSDKPAMVVFAKADGPTVKLIHRPSRAGFKGGALQVALVNTDAKAKYIIVLDADFVPYADTLEQFIKTFQVLAKDQRIAAVQGYQWHVLNKSQTWVTRGVRTEYAGSYVIERSGEELYGGLKQIAGAVYAIRADILRQFGWGTSITEDFELTLRLYEAGYKVAFTPYIQAPAEAVSTIRRLIRQRMRWAEGASHNVKIMLPRIFKSANLTAAEKLEFAYLAPYYLQAAFFVVGTFSWFLSEAVLHARLPFWTAAFGWSLVFTNLLALPLMNIIGMFLEESDERDYVGILSFIALSYIVVPFQAYAAIKGFLEREEGPWFRTPKTGLVTDVFNRSSFSKLFGSLLGGRPAVVASANYSSRLAFAPAFDDSNRNLGSRQKNLRLVGRSVLVALLILALSLNLVSFGQNDIFSLPGKKALKVSAKNDFGGSEKPQFRVKIPPKAPETKAFSFFQRLLAPAVVEASEPEVRAQLFDSKGQEVKGATFETTSAESDSAGADPGFRLTLANPEILQPGKYTLKIKAANGGETSYEATQDFTWGVVAVNTNKSIYMPGEVAKLAFGVLDNEGNTLCNSKLKLKVQSEKLKIDETLSTENGKIKPSGQCQGNNYVTVPDYTAEYKVENAGIYQLSLTVQTENGVRTIEDQFEVWESVPFDVERTSYPTRIKTSVEYPVELTIVANQDFKGEVVESVPDSFEIKYQNAKIKNTDQNSKSIIWEVDWKKGEKHTLSYAIKFPPESPQFYLLGPLKLFRVNPRSNLRESAVFVEQRRWQIAADAPGTTFMETPDATQAKEFWSIVAGTVTYDTTQKKSGLASWKADSGGGGGSFALLKKTSILADAGRRITFYLRLTDLPSTNAQILQIREATEGNNIFVIQVTTGGILQLLTGGLQIGSNGSTLSTGIWYRLSLAYTITSTTVYEIRLYLNGTLDITGSNSPTLVATGTDRIFLGWSSNPGANKVLNFHHVYVDDSAALTDTGDIRVTAKLPNAVVHNSFDTTGGTGAVNERPISETNYKQHAATTQVHQDYDIQAASAGDNDISGNTYVAFDFWIWADDGTGANGTPKLVYQADTELAIDLDAASKLFQQIVDTSTYPSAGASVIGMESTGAGADTLFYEGGVLVAFLGDPVPEIALVLAPLSFFAPKIIKSIQKGTLVADFSNLIRRMFAALGKLLNGYIARLLHCYIVKLLRKRRGKKDG